MIFPKMAPNNEVLVITGAIRATFYHNIYEKLGSESSVCWNTFVGFFFFYKIIQVSIPSYHQS